MIQNCGKSSIGLIAVLIAIVLSGMFTSCAHRPLEDPYNGHYIRIYIFFKCILQHHYHK